MCELARSYFRMGGAQLPQALYWWRRAAAAKDEGALADLQSFPIKEAILHYRTTDSEFADMVIRCAMLSEWVLAGMRRTS